MPGGEDNKPKKRAPTLGDRNEDRKHSATAGTLYAPPVELPDEITGQYRGPELAAKRAERDVEVRAAILEVKVDDLRANLKTTDKLVNEHNTQIQIGVLPVIKRVPRELEAIRAAQTQLDAAFASAIRTTEDAIADMTRQLQRLHERVESHDERLDNAERAAQVHSDRLRVVEATAATHATELAALTAGRSVDVRVGSWVRRNLTSILVTVLSTVGGLVAGYLATKLGVSP